MARKLVSFDWAVKRLLRSKVNFAVLEGFLSELLKEEIKIQDVLESESNKDTREQHQTKVDLLVKNSDGTASYIKKHENNLTATLDRIYAKEASEISPELMNAQIFSLGDEKW